MDFDEPCVSDLLVLVASSEARRGMQAEARRDHQAAIRHMMAAGHLELVLARDYERAGKWEESVRSRMSAAAFIWRGGDSVAARTIFDEMRSAFEKRIHAIDVAIVELERDFPVPPAITSA